MKSWEPLIKVIILAGGLGTRIMEETETKPKPMVLIDGKPILWHVMNIYALQGFRDFIIATGYKHEVIETWVNNLHENWSVFPLFTGTETQTGGRIKRCIETFPSENYMITYGDGLANIDLTRLNSFHQAQGRLATVTAVRPPARFGVLHIEDNAVTHFGEKIQTDAGWINGGFFVCNKSVTEYIDGDSDLFESGPLAELARIRQLTAFKHHGFWHPMDTLREKNILSELAKKVPPPWYQFTG